MKGENIGAEAERGRGIEAGTRGVMIVTTGVEMTVGGDREKDIMIEIEGHGRLDRDQGIGAREITGTEEGRREVDRLDNDHGHGHAREVDEERMIGEGGTTTTVVDGTSAMSLGGSEMELMKLRQNNDDMVLYCSLSIGLPRCIIYFLAADHSSHALSAAP